MGEPWLPHPAKRPIARSFCLCVCSPRYQSYQGYEGRLSVSVERERWRMVADLMPCCGLLFLLATGRGPRTGSPRQETCSWGTLGSRGVRGPLGSIPPRTRHGRAERRVTETEETRARVFPKSGVVPSLCKRVWVGQGEREWRETVADLGSLRGISCLSEYERAVRPLFSLRNGGVKERWVVCLCSVWICLCGDLPNGQIRAS